MDISNLQSPESLVLATTLGSVIVSPKVKDTLCEEDIHFPPYDGPELEAILHQRADGALYDDAAKHGVISLCAALAAQDTGSARQALNLIYKAGEMARAADESEITEDHVHNAREALEQSQIEHGMRELTQHGHLSLVATLTLALEEEETPARVKRFIPGIELSLNSRISIPLVRRRMHDHLADLAMLGILNRQSRNEGRAGGQYYEYEFNVGLKLVCEVVDTLDGVALSRRIEQHLRADPVL